MASTYISRTTGTPTDNQKCTVSFWWKNSEAKPSGGSDRVIFGTETTAASYIYLRNTGEISVWQASTGTFDFRTTRLAADPSAWYHICYTIDTTLADSTARVKVYVNGVRETAFNASSAMAQDSAVRWNEASKVVYIGGGFNQNMNGLLSHFHFIDGTAYDASTFGETDSTSGIWKIKTGPSVTYGDNGFFLKFEDSSNMDLDSSPNAHTFTTSGNLTATKDNPSNNFCTWNPLAVDAGETYVFENGNTVCLMASASGWSGTSGTLAAAGGKWYMEGYINYTPAAYNTTCGWTSTKLVNQKGAYGQIGYGDKGSLATGYGVSIGVYDTGTLLYSTDAAKEQSTGSWATAWAAGDYLMFAIDIDGGKFYFGANGTWDSGASNDPAAGTGGASFVPGGLFYTPITTVYQERLEMNFGNGYFSTTVAGTNADANGEGAFKYTPPSGFYAMCTNNLKLYGAA